MNRKTILLTSLAAAALGGSLLALSSTAAEGPADAAAPAAHPAPARPATLSVRPLPPSSRAAVDALFDDPDVLGETRAVLILRDGQPVYERYADGFGPDTRLISWSMAKSVTAVLIGILVTDGRLALDAPAPVPAWQRPGDPRGAITLRQLLHMSSGLEHVEVGDPLWVSDTTDMLFGPGIGDMAAFAEAKPPVARADEVFNYSSATSVILSDIIARTLTDSDDPVTRRDTVLDFVRGRLSEPLGMTSLTPEFDAHGTMIGGSFMHATARDYAKFGELLRNMGVAGGTRHVPESWIRFMLTPSPRDPGYGGHIWLNRPRPAGADPTLWPERGPNDLFACVGYQGQYIVVSPSQRVTMVRLGVSTREQTDALRLRIARAMQGL